MDNFIDKITQKLNSQDMIRANSAADAAELESLENQLAVFKEQMEQYDGCLQEMRKLNLKNIENAQEVQNLTDQASDKIEKTAGAVETASVSKIQQTSEASIAGIQQTVTESLAKIAEIKDNTDQDKLEKISEVMTELQIKMDEAFRGLEDYTHTDNVKVYRNVQAAMIEELEKQTKELVKAQERSAKSNKLVLVFVIIAMAASLADLVIFAASLMGLL